METFSRYWPFVVTRGFPSQRASNMRFDVLFDVSLNKPLNKHSNCRWFEAPWRPCDVTVTNILSYCGRTWWEFTRCAHHWANSDSILTHYCSGLTITYGRLKSPATWLSINQPFTCQIFQREHKHTFTFCVISPHWYDAGSWNPSSNKTRIYLFYIVNIMAADVLAT